MAIVEALMKRFGAAPTRENYLRFAHLGKPPEDSAELEETIPDNLKYPTREYDKLDATAIPPKDEKNPGDAEAAYGAIRGMSRVGFKQ